MLAMLRCVKRNLCERTNGGREPLWGRHKGGNPDQCPNAQNRPLDSAFGLARGDMPLGSAVGLARGDMSEGKLREGGGLRYDRS